MRVVFYELEGWERPYLQERLPGVECDFLQHAASPADAELGACEILSPFIFSRITPEVMGKAPKLKLVTTRSTGFDHVDLAGAKERGIAVSNVPEYGSNTVAEHTMALLLAISRRLIPSQMRTRTGRFTTDGLRGFDLRGKTLGVIGTGNIGLHMIRMARGFGMHVIAFDPYPRNAIADVVGYEYVSLAELYKRSDVVSLHCPGTGANKHLINKDALSQMKRGVVLLNTARGVLVNTHDLLAALESGHVYGAGLDVLDGEGAIKEDIALEASAREQLLAALEAHRVLIRDDVITTPHNAFNSEEAVRRILDTTIENIRAFIEHGAAAHPVPVRS